MKPLIYFLILLFPMYGIAQAQSHASDLQPWEKARKYSSEGFQPLDTFAGQATVRGKRIASQPFSIFTPGGDMKCCGELVKSSRTDKHGHFFIEPLSGGEYFVEFKFKGVQYITRFAILADYQRTYVGRHIEINFSNPNSAKIQDYVDIDDSGSGCQESEPGCFRK